MKPFPNKKYQIIYADPPWSYRDKALYVLPNSENSKGTQKEIKKAIELNIPVFYSIGDL